MSAVHRHLPESRLSPEDHAALIALSLSVLAVATQIPGTPVIVRGLVLGAFVLLGPGCALRARLAMPSWMLAIVLPCVGISVVVICTCLSTMLIGLSSRLVLAVTAGAIALLCIGRVKACLTRSGSPL